VACTQITHKYHQSHNCRRTAAAARWVGAGARRERERKRERERERERERDVYLEMRAFTSHPSNQCLARILGIIRRDPRVSKSNRLHVDIFR
jgi:hypothetical protein